MLISLLAVAGVLKENLAVTNWQIVGVRGVIKSGDRCITA
jgi:hypothetical protein